METTHYILGSVAGPHPYPMMVRDFHAVIGKEARAQSLEKWGGKPDVLVACVGGGSNAMGLFHEFIDDEDVRIIGVEAAGEGMGPGQKHAATLTLGSPGVLHGSFSYLIQDEEGQIIEPHSISAGLDYPGIGPEHSFLKDFGRAEYHAGDGPGGARRVRQSVAMRGDHPRARDVSRLRLPREAHADAEEGAEGHPELQRARRQGREHRGGGAQHLGRGGHLNAREKHDFLTSVVVSRIYKVKPLYSNRARDEPTTRAAGCYIRWTRAQTRPPLPCVRC